MQDDESLRRRALGTDTDTVADDLVLVLVLVELELDARPSGQDLAVFGQRHYGMRPGDRAVVVVEISGTFSQRSPEASARRKALHHDARTLPDAVRYRIDLIPSRHVCHVDPCREDLPTRDRLARPDAFRQHLATTTPPPDARSARTPQPTADEREGARRPENRRG